MPSRPLLIFTFVIFFTALVPVALACEVSAHSHTGCGAVPCGASRGIEHCAGDRVTHAPTISKRDGSHASHPPVTIRQHGPAAPFDTPIIPSLSQAIEPGLPLFSPVTLLSLSVLLRI
jgi:hypothetical protein